MNSFKLGLLNEIEMIFGFVGAENKESTCLEIVLRMLVSSSSQLRGLSPEREEGLREVGLCSKWLESFCFGRMILEPEG